MRDIFRQVATKKNPKAPKPAGRLDDQLCFALYAATNAITRMYRPLLSELGLTYPQYLVLLVLWEGSPRRLGEIAAELDLASHAVTPIIDRLEETGLVKRTKDPADGRAVAVELTMRGRELESSAITIQRTMRSATQMRDEDIVALRDELRGLADRLHED